MSNKKAKEESEDSAVSYADHIGFYTRCDTAPYALSSFCRYESSDEEDKMPQTAYLSGLFGAHSVCVSAFSGDARFARNAH